jgi:exodeoxyribonuclease V
MSLQLSAEQERARTAFLQWFRSPHKDRPFFYLQGFAGVGKSQCVTAITASIRGKVLYAAPTGRAALIMQQKGCEGAQTLHSLLYKPKGMSGDKEQGTKLRQLCEMKPDDPKAESLKSWLTDSFKKEVSDLDSKLALCKTEQEKKPLQVKKEQIKRALQTNFRDTKELASSSPLFDLNLDTVLKEACLLVIDEISMVSRSIIEDVLSFNVPILVQGDPGQLPPVKAKSYFDHVKADFCLTEIHRQAADSPIIYLATLARQGKPLPLGMHGNCLVTQQPNSELFMQADQIIVGMHKTRHKANAVVRKLLSFEGEMPNVGEKVICRKNNNKLGLANGDQFTVSSFNDLPNSNNQCMLGVRNESLWTTVRAWKHFFQKTEPNPWIQKEAESFDLSYAITCHLAQGGAWPHVYVKDESKVFRQDASKHLYTSLTRASDRVTVQLT